MKMEDDMKESKKTYIPPCVEIISVRSKDIITLSLPDETVDD